MSFLIRPARNLRGSLRLPGDKSISHRYAMLAGIAAGLSRFENFAGGADCTSTLRAMHELGCEIQEKTNPEFQTATVEIMGSSFDLKAPSAPLNCGNSGSTMRMLAGILAGQEFVSELAGDASLSRRPMARIIEPLRTMGADITATENHAPLRIRGGNLQGIDYVMPVASAQVKTGLLFAGLYAQGETIVQEPVRTREHGETALKAFGAAIDYAGRCRLRVKGGRCSTLAPVHAVIPGDISSAAFLLCAAALFPESNLILDDLLLSPTRAAILDVLRALGLRLHVLQVQERHGELAGVVQARGGELRGTVISGPLTAALIDELPVLAVIGPYCKDGVEIRDAQELRVKESDRIAALVANLRAMNAQVQEFDDGLRVPGNQQLHGAELQSFGDHRIAMAFAIAALRAQGDTLIHGSESADISFPGFFTALEGLVER